ncbi:MAG: mechanosensitive ion channel [Elusimicrobia bacterium]|nr:mechanosensitive ion channel [Elusimicrobiota bacterium]MDE2424856.1 mechanosensitive ion channel [Elusimicrobiota bacterium]
MRKALSLALSLALLPWPSSAMAGLWREAGPVVSVKPEGLELPPPGAGLPQASEPLLDAASIPSAASPEGLAAPGLALPLGPAQPQASARAAEASLSPLGRAGLGAALAREPAAPAPREFSRWSDFWSGKASRARTAAAEEKPAASPTAPATAQPALGAFAGGRPPRHKRAGLPRAAALLGAAVPAVNVAAAPSSHWALLPLLKASPLLFGTAVLAATYAASKLVAWAINRAARRNHWNDDDADTARFLGTLATWSAGAAGALYLTQPHWISEVFLLAASLAARKIVTNLLYGIVFRVVQPFSTGDVVRINGNLLKVEGFLPQRMKFSVLGALAAAAPDSPPAGVTAIPLARLDPLGREQDDQGNRFVLASSLPPVSSPSPAQPVWWPQYSQLVGTPFTLYKDFDTLRSRQAPPLELMASLGRGLEQASASSAKSAVPLRRSLRRLAYAAAGLVAVKVAMLAWPAAALLAWPQAALIGYVFWLASNLLDGGLSALSKRNGWNARKTFWLKLLSRVAVLSLGAGTTLRSLGYNWRGVLTRLSVSLGLTTVMVSFLSSDLLGNLTQAVMTRFSRPFRIDDPLTVGAQAGRVAEMNLFYLVLRLAGGGYTLLPYSALESSGPQTWERPEGEAR